MVCFICGNGHPFQECCYPQQAKRCETCYEMIFTSHHQCAAISNYRGYRTDVLAVKTSSIFKLRIENNAAEIKYFNQNDGKFDTFFSGLNLLCPATNGVFTVRQYDEHNIIHYESSTPVKFKFFIALLGYNSSKITLQLLFTPGHGLTFTECDSTMIKRNGKLEWTDQYGVNAVFVLGLLIRANMLVLQTRTTNASKKSITFENQRWKVPDAQDIPQIQHIGSAGEKCLNCNGRHLISKCDWPSYSKCCTGCLVVSFDGTMHESPCMPTNKISQTRADLLASNALTLFQFLYETKDATVLYLDDGVFSEMTEGVKLISGPAEGMLIHQESSGSRQCIAFKQTSFKRCAFLLAIMDHEKIFRLRFRLVVTPKGGLLVFPLTKSLSHRNNRYEIPLSYKNNTVALLGVRPAELTFYAQLRVYANNNGNISTTPFNGYDGYIGIDLGTNRHEKEIDNALDGTKTQPERLFDSRLYKQEPKPVSNYKEQQRFTG